MARPHLLLFSILLIATISVVALAVDCVFEIKVRTGLEDSAGTNSVIGVKLEDQFGNYFEITDLVWYWGAMPPGHNYFERGNLDTFRGTKPCLPHPVCILTLSSDNTGTKPGWYVDYVDITWTKDGSPRKRQHFSIDQWLATDEPPYELSTKRDNCPEIVGSENRTSLYSVV